MVCADARAGLVTVPRNAREGVVSLPTKACLLRAMREAKSRSLFLIPALVLGIASSAAAATGTLSAIPSAVVVAPSGTGTTTLTWTSAGTPTADVWVSLNDLPDALVSRAPAGSASASWIVAGFDYEFVLYENVEHTRPLARQLVLGVPAGGGNVGALPRVVRAPRGGVGSTSIQWATNDRKTAEVWVSMDGQAETLLGRAASSSTTVSWIQPGHSYVFRLYASTGHSELLDSVTVWGEPDYSVAVNYHSTGTDFSASAFITRYHLPGVRSTVQQQLQGMADRGASMMHTRLWMVTSPGGVDFGEPWRAHFPLSAQETANLRAYAQDVAAIRASDGHRLRLDLTLLWLGDADYQLGNPTNGLGSAQLSAAVFTQRTRQTIASVIGAVSDLVRPDGLRLVETINLDGEVLIGAKANQEWFLRTHYPEFVQSAKSAGLTPSLYFLAGAKESDVFNDGFIDPEFPILNGRPSMFWVYRSLRFLRNEGLPLPQRIDFSCYSETSGASIAVVVQRLFDQADATLPSLGLASRYGVAETFYPLANAPREALGDAFAAQRVVGGRRLERVQFWTTPDGAAPGVPVGYPFEVEDYLP